MSDYATKVLWEALYSLVSAGSLQTRLAYAARELTKLQDADFADAHRAKFTTIMRKLTWRQPEDGEGSIDATTRQLNNEEGQQIAIDILSLYTELRGGIS